MSAIRFDAVFSTTTTYRTDGVVKRFSHLKASELTTLRETCPVGQHVICTGWVNPNPGTWITD